MIAVEVCAECDIADCHHIRERRAALVADTDTDYRKAMLYHSDRADAFMAERDELAAAIDSIETSNGLTSNGNLWRFWVKKSQELLDKNKVLSAQLTTLQREAVTQARHDVKIYAMTAERDAAVARVLKLPEIAALVEALNEAQYGLSWAFAIYRDANPPYCKDPCPPVTRGLNAVRKALAALVQP